MLCTLMCMEGVVYVDVHGVCCVVGGCNVVATEHGRYSLFVCRNCEQ